jgi:hypothetical protein
VLARSSLREKRVEGIVTATNGLVRRHLTVRLDAVLQAVQLPARVTSLDTALTHVDADHFTHGLLSVARREKKKTDSLLP